MSLAVESADGQTLPGQNTEDGWVAAVGPGVGGLDGADQHQRRDEGWGKWGAHLFSFNSMIVTGETVAGDRDHGSVQRVSKRRISGFPSKGVKTGETGESVGRELEVGDEDGIS